MAKVKEIVNFLLEKFPLTLASNFDMGKVGLQFGNPEAVVKKVLICLDATSKVVDEAINNDCQMVIAHHPYMFSPLLNMNYNTPFGKKMTKVIKNDLNVFAMHTNFDCGENGMNDILSSLLGLKDVEVLGEVGADNFLRIGRVEKMTLEQLVILVKEKFNQKNVRIVGDLNKQIKKVAICGGAGGSLVVPSALHGADCLITGEIHHNNAIDAEDFNIACIEVSHGVEALYKEFVQKMLKDTFNDVEFILAKEDKDPFSWM